MMPVVFIPGGLALGFLGPPDMLLFHLVSYVFMGVMGIPGYFFFRNPKNLQRCHVWVKALADRGEHSEAAGVAALMGKYGPRVVRVALAFCAAVRPTEYLERVVPRIRWRALIKQVSWEGEHPYGHAHGAAGWSFGQLVGHPE